MKRISMLSLVIAFLAAIMDIQGAGELHGPVTATVLGPTAVTVGSFTAPGAFCEVSR